MNSLNRDKWEGDERFSAVGMRITGRIHQLKRIDRIVIEKIVSEEINSELNRVFQEAKTEEKQRCLEAVGGRKSVAELLETMGSSYKDLSVQVSYKEGFNQAIDQAISAITNLAKVIK